MTNKSSVPADTRYDDIGHWAVFDNKNSRSRCKLPGCVLFTHAFCVRCDIHLCCSKNHNCFRSFHDPPKAVKNKRGHHMFTSCTFYHSNHKKPVISKRVQWNDNPDQVQFISTPKCQTRRKSPHQVKNSEEILFVNWLEYWEVHFTCVSYMTQ